jgi:peptidoglycan/xylan/chitin deacetylase (PgdA/CDA1 family)
MDDIQDYWLNSIQTAAMNLFMSKNQSLSLGLITHITGNDSKIVDKVKEGLHKGLFELDLHGWDHINYTKLNEIQQTDSLSKANAKVQRLFGMKSIVFIPPYDVFNDNTLKAMRGLGIRIVSSGPAEENRFDQNRSVFVANGNKATTIGDNNTDNNGGINQSFIIYHLPATIFFKDFQNGGWVKTPSKDILGNVTRNIAKYGYAVIVLHPQDFAKSIDGTFTNSIDQNEILDLSKIMDFFSSNNLKITSFHKVVT